MHVAIKKNTELYKYIKDGAVLLTPNLRLTLVFTQLYNKFMQNNNISIWSPGNIYPLSQWVRNIWNDCAQANNIELLSDQAQYQIWKNIISNHDLNLSNNITTLAIQAYSILKEWHTDYDECENFSFTEESKKFLQWAYEYEKYCCKNKFTDKQSIIQRINDDRVNTLPMNQNIIFGCFDDSTPQTKLLINTLEQNNNQILLFDNKKDTSITKKYLANSKEDELNEMVHWAQHEFEKHNKTIACVVPSLKHDKTKLAQICSEVFSEYEEEPYNFSAGDSFLNYPLIKCLYKLLSLKHTISLSEISFLLSTPFIKGGFSEAIHRNNLINKLYNIEQLSFSIFQIIELAEIKESSNHCPIFATILKSIQELNNIKETKLSSTWSEHIIKTLTLCGWPGDRTLTSNEYQSISRLHEILISLNEFDSILNMISFSKILEILNDIFKNTEFQPKSEQKPIQFLGLLESAGLLFDSMWICGLTNEQWPQSSKPNPFIPIQIQKKYNMPHASHERELDFSIKMNNRLQASADLVVFSSYQRDDDKEFKESSLISTYPSLGEEIITSTSREQIILNSSKLESFNNHNLNITKDKTISGGAYLFKYFFECPFKAISTFQLKANTISTPTTGISPKTQGNIIHHAMDIFWGKIQNQKNLLKLSEHDLMDKINECISIAIFKNLSKYYIKTNPVFIQLEKNRLTEIIYKWMQNDKNRPNFDCIHREKTIQATIGQLLINVRIDRIDRLNTGELILIDYKTGKTNMPNWFEEKLDEPQLLIYLITSKLPISAISFAQINAYKQNFIGISQNETSISNITTIDKISDEKYNWVDIQDTWEKQITKAAKSIIAGHALPDPKKGVATCNTCNMHALCGIKRT